MGNFKLFPMSAVLFVFTFCRLDVVFADGTKPAPIELLSISYSSETGLSFTVELKWSQSTDDDFKKYILFGDTAFPASQLLDVTKIVKTDTTVSLPYYMPASSAYIFSPLKVYHFRIAVMDSFGNVSDTSQDKTIIMIAKVAVSRTPGDKSPVFNIQVKNSTIFINIPEFQDINRTAFCVYSLSGKLVFISDNLKLSNHEIAVTPRAFPGIYFWVMKLNGKVFNGKINMLR